MSAQDQGMHAHPDYKLGRRPPKNAVALMLGDILSGEEIPEHPPTADHFNTIEFGLYENDKYGDCGPTSVANLARLVSTALTGTTVVPSQDDVFDLYRRSGNPNFDPNTGADDNGVDMQTMLEALLAGGIGDGKGGNIKPIAFAKVDVTNDSELDAAVSIFGGVLWGATLQTAQQQQSDGAAPKWDFDASSVWGGHAIVQGQYQESDWIDAVISWAKRIQVTAAFRRSQLEEAWVVIWPWNMDHPAFQNGIDLDALRRAYHALTGKELATQ